MVELLVNLWAPYLGLSITRLVKIMALQVDVNSSGRCADLAKLHVSAVSQFSVLCLCLIALFTPLLRVHVAMPHGTSRLYINPCLLLFIYYIYPIYGK